MPHTSFWDEVMYYASSYFAATVFPHLDGLSFDREIPASTAHSRSPLGDYFLLSHLGNRGVSPSLLRNLQLVTPPFEP